MRVGSLFSGVGLGDLGLTQAGMEIAFQVEIEPYARKVLELRWPDVPKFGDIRGVHTKENCPLAHAVSESGEVGGHDKANAEKGRDGRNYRSRSRSHDRGKSLSKTDGCPNCLPTPPCDLLAGGFPCQDISVAGKGAGLQGARSGLWSEFHRLIREIRPRYVLVENVTALLGRGLGTVLGDLAESGYDAEWDCIPASALGAPHQRDRVWIVAYSGLLGSSKYEVETMGIKQRRESSDDVADTKSEGLQRGRPERSETRSPKIQSGRGGGTREILNPASPGLPHRPEEKIFRSETLKEFERSNRWPVEPNVGRVAHGVPSRVDRLKGLGNGQVVQVVQYIGERIIAFDNQRIINAKPKI